VLGIAPESRPLVGVCIVDRINGGLSEFGAAFDGTLGTAVVYQEVEARGVEPLSIKRSASLLHA
jgi:hypothetical protein